MIDRCQEEEACKGMLLKHFEMRRALSMLEKREMVSTRKKNRNTVLVLFLPKKAKTRLNQTLKH